MTSHLMRHDRSHKLLRGTETQENYCSCSICELPPEENNFIDYGKWLAFWMSIVFGLCLIASCESPAHAEVFRDSRIAGYSADQWANAIYKAENSPSHPYGIMAKYRHTSPRKACINTVRHQYRIWCKSSCSKTFLAFLASKYAPLQASNDPFHLNNNWERNVSWFLTKGV